MTREEPKTGEIWKHFKGANYQIICVGHHSETGEKMVVYRRYYWLPEDPPPRRFDASFIPCIRPLDMFMSEVDHKKYPNIKQKYRFEMIEK